jgi:hypothetical protein
LLDDRSKLLSRIKPVNMFCVIRQWFYPTTTQFQKKNK